MPISFGYLGKHDEDIFDESKPLRVTSAGNYKIYSQKERKTTRPNGRKDWQIIYIVSGRAIFYFEGEKRVVSKGNLIILRPGEPQLYYLYAADKPEIYWTHFTGYDIKNILRRYDIFQHENVTYIGTSPDYVFYFKNLIRELQLHRASFEDMLELNLRQLFLTVSRYIKESKHVEGAMIDEIERATGYFTENYNKNIIIEDYAAERKMTACWFIKNFKEITGSTPRQYIISLRIQNAIDLLENTNSSINQISLEVGYDNSLYFSRLFKKQMGVSPMEYKKRKLNFE